LKKILNYKEKEQFIPTKFFKEFLEPLLIKKQKKISKKEILDVCEKIKK